LDAHQAEMTRRNKQYVRLQSARKTKLAAYQVLVEKDPDAGFAVAELENDIEEAEFNHSVPLPIVMYGEDKANFDAQWRMYREKLSKLEQQRGQAYSMVRGQCMPVLLDKMKHDPEWAMTTKSFDPLLLMKLIEKTILAQTDDQYPYATVYDLEVALFGIQQNELKNEQWYTKFNTRIDVGDAIGVTRYHKVLVNHTAKEKFKKE
jgi:hypothetical protein